MKRTAMKKTGIAVAMVLFAAIGTAQAADQGFYTGAALGGFELDPGSNKKTAFGGFVLAGMVLHPNLAIEGRVGASGTTDNADFGPAIEQAKADWFLSVLAKPQFELSDGLRAYGLLGLTSLKASFTGVTGAKKGIKQSKTTTNFSFGVGGEYDFTPQLALGGEWMRYSSKADSATRNTSFKGLDVNGFSAVLRYSF